MLSNALSFFKYFLTIKFKVHSGSLLAVEVGKLRLKILAPTSFLLALLLSYTLRIRSLSFLFMLSLLASSFYMGWGMREAIRKRCHILNELPNALRLFLALLGGFLLSYLLLTSSGSFMSPSIVIPFILLTLSIVLNDESLRRAYRRVIAKNKGFYVMPTWN